jgi:hypothetical protein
LRISTALAASVPLPAPGGPKKINFILLLLLYFVHAELNSGYSSVYTETDNFQRRK